ncbi:gluconolactonase [Cyclobacterium lianum]|uniref:Gluconolactonase n=2 Tax=Cyclobacterium lianum TaxID=388280 RepID=A0A1M7JKZ2_9BACT|nr:gluconolactonase [Cyclobacterium lianum]
MHKPDQNALPDPETTHSELILELEHYTEGPAVDPEGSFYFTDLAGQGIRKVQGGRSVQWGMGGRPNGQAILRNGDHLICDSFSACVLKYDSDGILLGSVSPERIEGHKVRCPNDIAIDPDRGFYFTDSVRKEGMVYFVGWDGSARIVARDIDFANGIVFQREKKFLWVAESYKNRILKVDLNAQPEDADYITVFAYLPFNKNNTETGNLPDGMALDIEGRLWVAHYGMQAVQVLSKTGSLLASYDSAIPLTSNVCFVGDEIWMTGGIAEPGPGRLARIKVGIGGYSLF